MILLLIALLAGTPGGLLLDEVLARRDYAPTVSYLRSAITGTPRDSITCRLLARIYDHQHRSDSSVVWWEHSLAITPNNDSCIVGRWNALSNRDKTDSGWDASATRALIAREASAFLDDTTSRGLTLAYDGLSLTDTALANTAALKLVARYPDSRRGYELIGAMFYDSLYPVWTNDTLKVPLIRRFLDRFPRSEWRQTFYMFLLSSRFGLKDTAGSRKDAAEMTADDTLDPFRYRYAAAIFNRLKFDPAQTAAYALKAIELEPSAKKPPNKPQEQWNLDYPPLYGAARLALAEAMKTQGMLGKAKEWLDDAILAFRWDSQQEATPGPFYCLLGEILEAQGDTLEALGSYARALDAGDSRGTWTVRADSGLRRLLPGGNRDVTTFGRSLLSYAGPCFTDVTDSAGLSDRRESRVAWGDYDNDGFDDLLLNGCRLLRNDSGSGFTDVTDTVGLTGAHGRGGIWGDFDNDGRLDIFMSGSDSLDCLWLGTGRHFTCVTVEAGPPAPGEGCAAADFDGDGWLDLYVANYENWADNSYFPDRLYRNARGRLVDRTDSCEIVPPWGENRAGRGVAWADFDDDGRPECFVANYRLQENFLWDLDRQGRFANRASYDGVSGDEVEGWFGHTIGGSWGDYDNDGDLDLFTADLAHPRYIEFSNRSRLYENLGSKASPRFRDRRAELGIRYEETHSDPAWADVDNDGDLDLYITSIYEGRRSFLYENRREAFPYVIHTPDMDFRDVTWLSGTRVFNGWGCAFSDFDNDGDMDLVVGSGSGVRLFRNNNKYKHHWLRVKVVGTKANRAGIGCRVTVTRGKQKWIREVEGGKGTMSQNSLVQHFGLGPGSEPVRVSVRFGPDSEVTLDGVPVDRRIEVREP